MSADFGSVRSGSAPRTEPSVSILHPSLVAEVATVPTILDAHVSVFYLLLKPLGENLLTLMALIHLLYKVEIVRKVCPVSRDSVGQLHESRRLPCSYH